jgi:hypothetical protein
VTEDDGKSIAIGIWKIHDVVGTLSTSLLRYLSYMWAGVQLEQRRGGVFYHICGLINFQIPGSNGGDGGRNILDSTHSL